MRNLVVSVEDHFASPGGAYSSRCRSAVAIAVGAPQDVLDDKVLAELRERLSAALHGRGSADRSLAVFAGRDALESARTELAGRSGLDLAPSKVNLLDAGAWIAAPPVEGTSDEPPFHRVQVVDAPLPTEVVVALRGVAELDLSR